MTNGTPIHLAPANTPPHPDHYVIYFTPQHCQCCNKVSMKQEVYAITFLRSVLGEGKRVKNARPIQWPRPGVPDALYNLPIRKEQRPQEELPFCVMCNSPSLSHWPSVPQPEANTVLLNTVSKTNPGVSPSPNSGGKPSTTKSPKAKPSLDDILGMV